jgi:hypothetical protein
MSQLRVNTITDAGGTGSTYAPGHVVQVVSVSKTNTFSGSSTTFTDVTDLSATITPKFANSKILVSYYVVTGNSNSSGYGTHTRLVRDSTPVFIGDQIGGSRIRATTDSRTSSNYEPVGFTPIFLDSPSTTSAITYKVQLRASSGTTGYVGRVGDDPDNQNTAVTPSSITLMEIAQ